MCIVPVVIYATCTEHLYYDYDIIELLKGCRPCRRPLTEETAKLGADGRNGGLVTADKFRGYSNPFVLMLTAARKLPKRCFWNLLKTKKKSRLKQSKPLRNVRLGSLQATRPNSRKRCLGRACEKAEPQQVLCPSHCETVAGKMPKRRCWNPLKRERNRAQTMRNRSQKTAETLLLDPTKNKNKEKTCKPPGQTQEKGVSRDRQVPHRSTTIFCNNFLGALPLTATRGCFWNLLKTKKKGCLKQGKPLRNVRLGSLQATRPNSRKRCLGRACEKAEPQQV